MEESIKSPRTGGNLDGAATHLGVRIPETTSHRSNVASWTLTLVHLVTQLFERSQTDEGLGVLQTGERRIGG